MTPNCAKCGNEVQQEWVDISALDSAFNLRVRGRWDQCPCGWVGEPVLMGPAPCLHAVAYGPAVPTPADLLAGAAGLALGAWR